jgi:hypothetical protein
MQNFMLSSNPLKKSQVYSKSLMSKSEEKWSIPLTLLNVTAFGF